MSGGFRDNHDEDDFGDLLTRPTTTSISSNYFKSEGTTNTSSLEDDISSNPFADMESSRVIYDLPTPSSVMIKQEEEVDSMHQNQEVEGDSSQQYNSRFVRESAPEPESPPLFHSTASDTPYQPEEDLFLPPLSPNTTFAPLSPSLQTPFGSPPPPSLPTTSTSPFSTTRASELYPSHHNNQSISKKIDLSSLLGEEKPILPSFNSTPSRIRDFSSSTSTSTRSNTIGGSNLLLPVSSIGNKLVGSALATLLGLEPDIIDEKVEEVKVDIEKDQLKKLEKKQEVEEVEEVVVKEEDKEVAILPPDFTTASNDSLSTSTTFSSLPQEALKTELPRSPIIESKPPPFAKESFLTGMESQISHLSLESTFRPSQLKDTTTTTPSSPIGPLDSNKLRATTSSSLFGDASFNSSSSTATTPTNQKGFKTFNDPEVEVNESINETLIQDQQEEQEQGMNDDRASTRGNYSNSLRGERIENDDYSSRVGTGANSPTGITNGGNGAISGEQDREREGERSSSTVRSDSVDSSRRPSVPNKNSPSPPSTLPSTSLSPSQTATREINSTLSSPPTRSTESGGSLALALAPSFVISVGDPQKVGSSLNVASQHTVYTVRTKTTSSAFRKPEFSVLRRFSHFLWLFETLTLSNPGVIVPGMPEKNALGRFGSDFVENRRSALQAALMKMVSHPMLVGDPDLRLFLESDSFSVDIKQRRLDIPSENKGFLASLVGSSLSSGPKFTEFDEYFENRKLSLDSFELQLKSLLSSLNNAAKFRTTLQLSIGELQAAFLGLSQCDLSNSLKKALEQAAGVQRRLRFLSEQQSESEEQIGGIISLVEGYARLCGSVRLVFGARVKAYHAAQAAESNLRKAKSAHEKSKRSRSDEMSGSLVEVSEAERKMMDTKRDFEDVSKLTRAEMVRFDKEKVDEFKLAIENYVEGMVIRQREVVATWQLYTDFLIRLTSDKTLTTPPVAPSV